MKTIILGCGGHGRVIRDILFNYPNIDLIGFLDDNKLLQNKTIDKLKVLGSFSDIRKFMDDGLEAIVIGIGDNRIRASFYEKSKDMGLKLVNVIHPSSIISKNVKIGEGIIIMPGAIINTGCFLNNNIVINTGAQLDHDDYLDDHCHIYPGAVLAGNVKIGKYSYVGMNASISQNLIIGNNSFVGMGSVVTKNVADNSMVYGNPAKLIKKI